MCVKVDIKVAESVMATSIELKMLRTISNLFEKVTVLEETTVIYLQLINPILGILKKVQTKLTRRVC